MPIETICKGCARKLRVADEYAGRKARCPHCKNVYEVPNIATTESPGVEANPTAVTDHDVMWRMRTTEGAVYGPVTRTELDEWCRDGRIAADAELQEQGSTGWVKATAVYSSLGVAAKLRAPDSNPFASSAIPQAAATVSQHHQSPAANSYYGAPHRGGVILTFGILSWVLCMFSCFLVNLGFAIAAWAMGRADLAAMRAGEMDPSGQSATQAGMILGIVNVVVFVAGIAAWAAFLVFAIISDGF
jgi:hypothetical protein